MKKFCIILLLAVLAAGAVFAAGPIAEVRTELNGTYFSVYNAQGRRVSQLLVHNGGWDRELLGVGGDFFVVKDGSYFVTYDSDCRKIEMLLILPGMTFGAVTGDYFTVRYNSYTRTYDRKCKKMSER
jgi:opacity protein-like surface antigen